MIKSKLDEINADVVNGYIRYTLGKREKGMKVYKNIQYDTVNDLLKKLGYSTGLLGNFNNWRSRKYCKSIEGASEDEIKKVIDMYLIYRNYMDNTIMDLNYALNKEYQGNYYTDVKSYLDTKNVTLEYYGKYLKKTGIPILYKEGFELFDKYLENNSGKGK